ncbi:hypothetical protein Btru_058810 [Bulinus truncatus]|nr:hypothetical protein Btru_058810 [Bulinus truncatus]
MEQCRAPPAADIKQEISCSDQTASTNSDSGISQSYDIMPDFSLNMHGYAGVPNRSVNTDGVLNLSVNTHRYAREPNHSANSRCHASVSSHSVNTQSHDSVVLNLSVNTRQSYDQVPNHPVNTAVDESSSSKEPAVDNGVHIRESSESSDEESSLPSEDIDVDGQDTGDDDNGHPVADTVQGRPGGPSRYEDSGVGLNRTVSPVEPHSFGDSLHRERYLPLYGDAVQNGLNYSRRVSDLHSIEVSGLSVNRNVSPVDPHIFASPQRDQHLNKPLDASTPVWRPWSGFDDHRSHFIGNISHIRPAHVNPPASSFGHMHSPHDYFPLPDELKLFQNYPFNPFNPFLPLLSSIQLPFRPSINYHQYPMMPLPNAGYSGSPRMTLPNAGYSGSPRMSLPTSGYSHSPRMTWPTSGYSHFPRMSLPATGYDVTPLMPLLDSGYSGSHMINLPGAEYDDSSDSQPTSVPPLASVPMQDIKSSSSSVSPPYQVPQVTSSYAIKRPSGDMYEFIPDKFPRYTSTPENNTDRPPLAEITPALNEQTQSIHGVLLSLPPTDALPARVSQRGKRKAASDNKNGSKESENTKRRDRPPPYGDHELHEVFVKFDGSPLKIKYCDINGNYRVPVVPDCPVNKEQLRNELLELFQQSNLPKVPTALRDNVDALIHFPHMQHLLSLFLDGYDLEKLQFGAYGQAFVNPKLASMSEDELNSLLDKMSYLGADGMMHCLVKRAVNNGAVCDHVAKEVGKMRRHAKNHYPEKKWVCCFCRAQMPDLTDMERHTSTHTVLKPFKCLECNKLFAQKVTLSHHMKNAHDMELEMVDPKKTLTCRRHGILFREHEREACLQHLEQHHGKSDDFKNRKRRRQWPYDDM